MTPSLKNLFRDDDFARAVDACHRPPRSLVRRGRRPEGHRPQPLSQATLTRAGAFHPMRCRRQPASQILAIPMTSRKAAGGSSTKTTVVYVPVVIVVVPSPLVSVKVQVAWGSVSARSKLFRPPPPPRNVPVMSPDKSRSAPLKRTLLRSSVRNVQEKQTPPPNMEKAATSKSWPVPVNAPTVRFTVNTSPGLGLSSPRWH